jgi:DNA polymerase elongation subunit (family B)
MEMKIMTLDELLNGVTKVTAIKNGKRFELVATQGDKLIVKTRNGLRKFEKTMFFPLNPRLAVSHLDGRVEIDLDRLDLSYVSSIKTPSWVPTTSVKPYQELSKIYFDIEATGLDASVDRVLMVGMMNEAGLKIVITDPDEKVILTKTIQRLRKKSPDLLIGHNLFNFDLPFLIARCKLYGISSPFATGRHTSKITASSLFGKPIEFTPIYWNGVNILDTFHQIAIWDKAAARLSGYGLKNGVIELGLREDRRLELSVSQIRACWDKGDVGTIQEYLEFDLADTQLLADFLLPVVYYQMNYVPDIKFQQLATSSPAKKAQKIHEYLLPRTTDVADEKIKFEGGKVSLIKPGLHSNVAKIDVSSLYPSIMLRYGICSRKDTENRFLGVLEYMRSERLRLKALGKQGDIAASFQEKSLKVLINGSYGYFGTGFYNFNDYDAAALVTAYGRKILALMVSVIESCGGKAFEASGTENTDEDGSAIEEDTDGVFFTHPDPEMVYQRVADALPSGIEIELEYKHCGLYIPKAKNYVLVKPSGKVEVKGIFRKRNRYPLENEFPIEFLKLYFIDGLDTAEAYYQSVRESLIEGSMAVEQLTITRKIGSAENNLVNLGIGKRGDRVSYWYAKHVNYHSRTGRSLKPKPIETNQEEYWSQYYLDRLDEAKAEIIPNPSQSIEAGLPLFLFNT